MAAWHSITRQVLRSAETALGHRAAKRAVFFSALTGAILAASLAYALPPRYDAVAIVQVHPRVPPGAGARGETATANARVDHAARALQATAKAKSNGVDVARVRNTLLLRVSYSSSDASLAASTLNGIVDAFAAAYIASDQPEPIGALSEQASYRLADASVAKRAEPRVKSSRITSLRAALIGFLSSGLLAMSAMVARQLRLSVPQFATGKRPAFVTRASIIPNASRDEGTQLRAGAVAKDLAYARALDRAASDAGLGIEAGASCTVVLVAAAIADQSAAVFASDVAYRHAVLGRRTLLVDADLQSEFLTRRFAPHRQSGLYDNLAASCFPDDGMLRDAPSGLYFLGASGPSGCARPAPDILSSRNFKMTCGDLRRRFDLIVIAAPSAVASASAEIISTHADAVLFVHVPTLEPRGLWAAARKRLSSATSRLIDVELDAEHEAMAGIDASGGGAVRSHAA